MEAPANGGAPVPIVTELEIVKNEQVSAISPLNFSYTEIGSEDFQQQVQKRTSNRSEHSMQTSAVLAGRSTRVARRTQNMEKTSPQVTERIS